MALVAPPAPVAAPARTPLPFGLGSVLGWRTGDRWQSGVNWQSITCGPVMGRGGPECDPKEVVGLPKDFSGERTLGEATPFVVYGHDACNMIANSFEEAQAFATNHLLAREEERAEQALWTGDLGNVPNFSGANGADAPIDLGAFSALDALAAVEQGIAEQYGSQGVIHMSRTTATLLGKHLEKRGGRLYTQALDTPVVAGSGYPDGTIVGTPAMFGYRGEVITASNRPGDLLDRATNTLYAVAEREYVIGIDACPLVSATITAAAEPAGTAQVNDEGAGLFTFTLTDGTTTDPVQAPPGVDGTDGTDGTDGAPGAPGDPGAPGAPGVVQAVVQGAGVTVDDTDPANPIVSVP